MDSAWVISLWQSLWNVGLLFKGIAVFFQFLSILLIEREYRHLLGLAKPPIQGSVCTPLFS